MIKIGQAYLLPSRAVLGQLLFSLSSQGKVKPTQLPLSWLRAPSCLRVFPPFLLLKRWKEIRQQGDEEALAQILHSLPKSQELKSFQLHPIHIFSLSDIPWWEQDLTGGEEEGNHINKSVIKFPLQMSWSGLGCYCTSFCHILDCFSKNSLLSEIRRVALCFPSPRNAICLVSLFTLAVLYHSY